MSTRFSKLLSLTCHDFFSLVRSTNFFSPMQIQRNRIFMHDRAFFCPLSLDKSTGYNRAHDFPVPRKAAVNLMLFENRHMKEINVVILRKENQYPPYQTRHPHAGELCFPGGMLRENEKPTDCVLRECEEEVFLPPHCFLNLVNRMPSFYTMTSNVDIYPFVSCIQQKDLGEERKFINSIRERSDLVDGRKFRFSKQSLDIRVRDFIEISDCYCVPLSELVSGWRYPAKDEIVVNRNMNNNCYLGPTFFPVETLPQPLWGASARILTTLLNAMLAELESEPPITI